MSSPKYSPASSSSVSSLFLDDFWAELDNISESSYSSQPYNELDEECSPIKALEGEAEADWLREAGFEDIVHSLEGDTQSANTSIDDYLLQSLQIPLTDRQAKTVKKKFHTLRSNLVKHKVNRKGEDVVELVNNSKHRPDVRSIFNKEEPILPYVTSPKSDLSEKDGNDLRTQSYSLEVPNNYLMSRTSSSPNLSHGRTSKPQEYGKFKAIKDDSNIKSKNLLNVHSNPVPNVKKESRFSWSGYKRAFKVSDSNSNRRNSHSSLALAADDSGIETLSVKYKSSFRKDQNDSVSTVSDENNRQINDIYTDHITPEALGIKIITKPDNHQFSQVNDLRLIASDVIRLEDLDEDMHKKIRTLALIELATIFDTYELEYEKIKRKRNWKKIKKNSENAFFGVPLIDLYNSERKRDRNCSIPFILGCLIEYIRTNGLHEEGIFRITGSQQRVQVLKEELEILSILRESNVEIFNTLSKYSIYDVCGVFKLFIRELPDPLLTNEFLEAFLLVPKISDYTQQIQTLNLLILLMNGAHKNSLEAVLFLLNDIILHEYLNKMSTHNIATVMAPNLFPNLVQKKIPKGGEYKEMELMLERAKDSLIVSKLLINSHLVLFQVPPYLIAQIQSIRK